MFLIYSAPISFVLFYSKHYILHPAPRIGVGSYVSTELALSLPRAPTIIAPAQCRRHVVPLGR